MKNVLTFSLLLSTCLILAQFIHPKISLKKDWKENNTFKGSIAGKNITLHLEYSRHSGWHDKVFLVKGWYLYDQYQKKIPLIGYYNGDLMLNKLYLILINFVGRNHVLRCLTMPNI